VATDPATIAWGGHLAGKYRLRETAPLLRDRLKFLREHRPGKAEVAQLVLLDGLIQSGATVPKAELRPLLLEGKFRAPALILLAREPRKNADLLFQIYEKSWAKVPPVVWHAAGNLLAANRISGFALRLLRDIKVDLWVYVYRPDRRMIGINHRGPMGGKFGGVSTSRPVPPDYPPVAVYQLQLASEALPGNVLLAPGPRPVYYQRKVSSQPEVDLRWRTSVSPDRRHEGRRGWILQLARGHHRDVFKVFISESVTWKDREHLDQEVERIQDRIRARYREIARCLEKDGLLSDKEAAGLFLRIETEIIDG
jgi:hypothetical protein